MSRTISENPTASTAPSETGAPSGPSTTSGLVTASGVVEPVALLLGGRRGVDRAAELLEGLDDLVITEERRPGLGETPGLRRRVGLERTLEIRVAPRLVGKHVREGRPEQEVCVLPQRVGPTPGLDVLRIGRSAEEKVFATHFST